jgi:hypothetical protein
MKPFFRLVMIALSAAVAHAVERIELGSGRTAVLTLPATWGATALPPRPPGMPAMGATVRYAPKDGGNHAVLITILPVPDERLADPANLQALIKLATRRYLPGSVEKEAELKEFKVGGKTGYACLFTDAKLVGQPPVVDDYKTMTTCFVYLGDRLMLNASIFSDDPTGNDYATARRLLQSLTITLPQNPI